MPLYKGYARHKIWPTYVERLAVFGGCINLFHTIMVVVGYHDASRSLSVKSFIKALYIVPFVFLIINYSL